MIQLTLKELAIAAQGQIVCSEQKATKSEEFVNEVVIDSRSILVNQANETKAFLALKGPTFDGHNFVAQVVKNGCCVVIVDHEQDIVSDVHVTQIIVDDTHKALGQIGAYVKAKVQPKTIGITGSSGKTTLKEMLAAILSNLGCVLSTNGNFNNDIGVPLTLLRLENKHEFAVIEMGANHAGEIAYTTNLVKPDIAIINNIAEAHLEGFGDLCGVANAKGEIYAGLSDKGIAIYNQNSPFTEKWQWRLKDKVVRTVSCNNQEQENQQEKPDCFSSDVQLDATGCALFTLHTPIGNKNIKLTIPGIHNVCNAVTAACGAIELGASLDDIALGLSQVGQVSGRLNLHHLSETLTLVDDTYNANVESVKAATALLASYKSFNILILGDMGELGEESVKYHQEIGVYASEQSINALLTLGSLSKETSNMFAKQSALKGFDYDAEHFDEQKLLLEALVQIINRHKKSNNLDENNSPNTSISILVKGSRSAHMERVVENIISWHNKLNKTTCQQKEDNV